MDSSAIPILIAILSSLDTNYENQLHPGIVSLGLGYLLYAPNETSIALAAASKTCRNESYGTGFPHIWVFLQSHYK